MATKSNNGNRNVAGFQIIKGSPDKIPSNLGRARNQYNWAQFDVGDHVVVPFDEAPSARSSATSFGRGTKTRAPRLFASATKEVEQDGKKVKVVEIWRLPDPAPVKAETKTH